MLFNHSLNAQGNARRPTSATETTIFQFSMFERAVQAYLTEGLPPEKWYETSNLKYSDFKHEFMAWAGCCPEEFTPLLKPPNLIRNHILSPEEITFDESKLSWEFGSANDGSPSPAATYGIISSHYGRLRACYYGEFLKDLLFLDSKWNTAASNIVERNFVHQAQLEAQLIDKQNPAFMMLTDAVNTNHTIPTIVEPRIKLLDSLLDTRTKIVLQYVSMIPPGKITSYRNLGAAIGTPKIAPIHIGQIIGSNRFANLVPCHRVIAQTGDLRGYAWGLARKFLMIGREIALNR